MNGKTVISFFAGAAIGAASAWFVTKKVYEKRVDAEVDAFRESYRRMSMKHSEAPESPQEEISEESQEDTDSDGGTSEGMLNALKELQNKYKSKHWEDPDPTFEPPEGVEDPDYDPDDPDCHPKEAPCREPYYITEKQFDTECTFYDKLVLYYDPTEAKLEEESAPAYLEEESENEQLLWDILGTEWREKIGLYEDNQICVRCEWLSIDYKIIAEPRTDLI